MVTSNSTFLGFIRLQLKNTHTQIIPKFFSSWVICFKIKMFWACHILSLLLRLARSCYSVTEVTQFKHAGHGMWQARCYVLGARPRKAVPATEADKCQAANNRALPSHVSFFEKPSRSGHKFLACPPNQAGVWGPLNETDLKSQVPWLPTDEGSLLRQNAWHLSDLLSGTLSFPQQRVMTPIWNLGQTKEKNSSASALT